MMLKVNSEFGTLKSLLVHRPGKEIDRLTPYNVKELLFEDVPYLEDMQHEHDEFTSLIKSVAGTKIYRLHDLLTDIFSDRKIIIDA
ncbi:MAG: arginine deiminase family protein, partial [Candidatus Sericytochromatia bacterium]